MASRLNVCQVVQTTGVWNRAMAENQSGQVPVVRQPSTDFAESLFPEV
jgi:hypothetical protein